MKIHIGVSDLFGRRIVSCKGVVVGKIRKVPHKGYRYTDVKKRFVNLGGFKTNTIYADTLKEIKLIVEKK